MEVSETTGVNVIQTLEGSGDLNSIPSLTFPDSSVLKKFQSGAFEKDEKCFVRTLQLHNSTIL